MTGKSLFRALRSLGRRGVVLRSLSVGLAVLCAPVPSEARVAPPEQLPAIAELDAIRTELLSHIDSAAATLALEGESESRVAQWLNWPNYWPNWVNWANWPNWRNYWLNF